MSIERRATSRYRLALALVTAPMVLVLALSGCQAPGSRYLATLPQCWEISRGLDQDWEEVQQNEATRECYQDGFRLHMQVRWSKTENKAELDFEYLESLSDQFYERSSTSIWVPDSNNVTKHATFYGREISDHLSKTCVGEVTHNVLAKSGRLALDVEGRGTSVWESPCLADDVIDGDAQPELVNRVMDMIILRLEHMDR